MNSLLGFYGLEFIGGMEQVGRGAPAEFHTGIAGGNHPEMVRTIEIVQRPGRRAAAKEFSALIFWFVLDQAKMNYDKLLKAKSMTFNHLNHNAGIIWVMSALMALMASLKRVRYAMFSKYGISARAIYFLAILFFLSLSSTSVLFGQITTNNALPVGKDKGIVRIQNKIFRATGDPTDLNRELLVQAFPAVGVYGVTPRFAVFGVIPLINKSLTLTIPQGRITRGGDWGLGDVRLFGRYDIYRKSSPGKILSFSTFGGAELPTGSDDVRDDFGRLPQPLQPGSGSWDPFGGFVLTWHTLEWFFTGATSYQINTEANNFEFGDEYRIDGVIKYRLFPRKLQSEVPGFFYLDLESNLVWQGKNVINDSFDDNSGGTTWFVDPGLQYITRKFVFEGAIQLPVAQDLNGNALKTDFITTLSVRMNL